MSYRIVSDIQCRAAGETFYIRYSTVAHIVFGTNILSTTQYATDFNLALELHTNKI